MNLYIVYKDINQCHRKNS